MHKLLFSGVAAAALAFVAVTPDQAKASWLSQALHAYFDRGYYNGPAYYDPNYPGYGYPYDPGYSYYYGPDYGAYGPVYGGYYTTPYYVPYRSYYYGPSYYRPWYGDHHRWHEWHEHSGHRGHEHHHHH
jgi:hypothetical protein